MLETYRYVEEHISLVVKILESFGVVGKVIAAVCRRRVSQ